MYFIINMSINDSEPSYEQEEVSRVPPSTSIEDKFRNIDRELEKIEISLTIMRERLRRANPINSDLEAALYRCERLA